MKASEKKNTVIKVANLFKAFGTNQVLKNFNLDVFEDESVAVLGKSGSGKSVLIKCIIGLINYDKGNINVLGQEISKLDIEELDKIRAQVGFLFQSNALYDSMTVKENLLFPLRRHKRNLTDSETDKLVEEALENVKLPETVNMMPSELSGGMKKRIALARTLILKPKIILYDEPTTGLDPITSREISNLMVEIQEKYKTSSVLISHDINCVKIVADRIVMLIDGTNYAQGTYSELKKSNDNKVLHFFD